MWRLEAEGDADNAPAKMSWPTLSSPCKVLHKISAQNDPPQLNTVDLTKELVSLKIHHLSYSTSESCLQKKFSNFGQIAEVTLIKDEATKKSKGFAFIQYDSQDAAMQALESMNHKYLDGRLIFVELAKPGKSMYGGYPRTCGPPKEPNLPDKNETVE
ncbi:hypothetical protein RJ639_006071 [Escallonia herrerae]|uniref:RRM domain-containing protein n=1 Tax=Escallonia herrerae TaxID=1293975 RepID=A0AA89AJH1_9ASTE|nr:hypothetical protein RJ639_017055 [Escallonia herrerae]KAK3016751.1 hypothetical protein RJ639_006071 [Escallonia herrerae]